MPPRRHWNFQQDIARRIVLRDGTRLRTLDDARALLIDTFDSVNAKSPALDHAIRLLLVAASTRTRDDIKAATDQIEIVLRAQQQLQRLAPRDRGPVWRRSGGSAPAQWLAVVRGRAGAGAAAGRPDQSIPVALLKRRRAI